MANPANPSKEIVSGRGNLSFTSINLVRLGIKHGIVSNKKTDMEGFYKELGEVMDLVKDQLLERFEIQCSKKYIISHSYWDKVYGLILRD